ncbi:MAG: asparagine synthase-related protein [Coriobacteriales bacterium]|nr:asparagine synthase-related protein [Coriobacteriales bacterium]
MINSLEKLKSYLIKTKNIAIALSGGCDSSVLLGLASEYGCDVKAYIIQTEFQRQQDIDDAVALCKQLNVDFQFIQYEAGKLPGFEIDNPQLCYNCKREMFERITKHASADGYSTIMDGTNADDDPEDRPGFKAVAEFNIVSPFRMFNIGKQEIRELGRELNIPQADKPNFACLAIVQRA